MRTPIWVCGRLPSGDGLHPVGEQAGGQGGQVGGRAGWATGRADGLVGRAGQTDHVSQSGTLTPIGRPMSLEQLR